MSKTIEEILTPKPEVRPRIHAYSIADKAHARQLKVGQTTGNVPSPPQRGTLRKPRATPWVKHDKTNKALKGRSETTSAHAHPMTKHCPALSGLGRCYGGFPRALPWAVTGRAVGAEPPAE